MVAGPTRGSTCKIRGVPGNWRKSPIHANGFEWPVHPSAGALYTYIVWLQTLPYFGGRPLLILRKSHTIRKIFRLFLKTHLEVAIQQTQPPPPGAAHLLALPLDPVELHLSLGRLPSIRYVIFPAKKSVISIVTWPINGFLRELRFPRACAS